MCDNFRPTEKKSFTGYKVVAKNLKTGRYHSFMTGYRYPVKGKEMPVWVDQKKQISFIINDDLLPGSKKTHEKVMKLPVFEQKFGGWRKQMVGRTSAFLLKLDAATYQWKVKENQGEKTGFDIIVVEVKLTGGLLKANIQGRWDTFVFVGRKLEIIEECEV